MYAVRTSYILRYVWYALIQYNFFNSVPSFWRFLCVRPDKLAIDITLLISKSTILPFLPVNKFLPTFFDTLELIVNSIIVSCKGELFSKFNTKLGYPPLFLTNHSNLNFPLSQFWNIHPQDKHSFFVLIFSNCGGPSKKVGDILIWFWTLKIIHLYFIPVR